MIDTTPLFGLALKQWRSRRRMSQLELGFAANVSARHIAFLETGRSNPSQPMVLQLSDALEVPRKDRNSLLKSAGFADAYHTQPLSNDDMGHVQQAMAWALERHDPYPAFALDRHWKLVATNITGCKLLGAVGLSVGDSLLDALVSQGLLWQAIENKTEILGYLISRLKTESAHLGGDKLLDSSIASLLDQIANDKSASNVKLRAVVPTQYRFGDQTLSLFSTIAQFGTAEDIALADLKIEFLFPADQETRAALEAIGNHRADS